MHLLFQGLNHFFLKVKKEYYEKAIWKFSNQFYLLQWLSTRQQREQHEHAGLVYVKNGHEKEAHFKSKWQHNDDEKWENDDDD